MIPSTLVRDELKFMLRAGAVTRWHVEHTIAKDTVGRHSHGVAWFCAYLCKYRPSANLLMAALLHDAAEHIAGDVPSPTKRRIPGLADELQGYEAGILRDAGVPVFYDERDLSASQVDHMWNTLTEMEVTTLKAADMFDAFMFCIRERQLGNTTMDYCVGNICKAFNDYDFSDSRLERIGSVYSALVSMWQYEVRK